MRPGPRKAWRVVTSASPLSPRGATPPRSAASACFPVFFSAGMLCLGGCATEPGTVVADEVGPTVCAEPRPQVCTMIYAPVCAEHRDGHRETHSSDCNACADVTVVAHVEGPCEPVDNTVGTL